MEGGTALDGTVYGPASSASAWKKPGCPLVPRAFRRSDSAFTTTIAQLKILVKQDDLTVNDLDSEFLTGHGIPVLPRNIVTAIRGDSNDLEYSPADSVIPAGVSLEWVLELPIPIRARRSINSLIAERRETGEQNSSVSVREFMKTRAVGVGTVFETLCVIESAEKQAEPTVSGQKLQARFETISENLPASIADSSGVGYSRFPAYSALQEFATWATAERLGQTFGEVIERIHVHNIDSDEWLDFAGLTLDGLADETKHPYVAIYQWVNDLSNRDSMIFIGRLNGEQHPRTLAELGLMLDLTRERVRQIESELKAGLRALAKRSRSVRWRCNTLRHEIGVASPLRQVEHLLLPEAGYPDYRLILLELAGPFKVDGDWVVLNSSVKSDPTRSLISSADPYGVIDIDFCAERLTRWGLDPSLHKSWLTRNDEVQEFNGVLFQKPNSAPERAAMALIDLGHPADVDTIINHIGWDGHRGTMANGLSNDARFIRVNRREWGLVDWDFQPYQTIAEAIRVLLEENGEPMRTDDVVNCLHARHGFVESSISSYFAAPAFVVENGHIRLRGKDDPYEYSASAIRRNRGVFKLGHRRATLLTRIDNDMLRGSGRAFMQAAAEILELQVGETLDFSQPNGPGATVYFNELSNSGPSLRSLQALVRNLEGSCDDYLVLVFDRNSMTAEPSLVKPFEIVRSWDTISRLTGLSQIDGLQALAASLQCDEEEVCEILLFRGDEVVVRALPNS